MFADSKVESNPKHWVPFGAPVYVLKDQYRDGGPFNKWIERSRVGIYLGKSPVHNKQVALVLDKNTGYVSPQFHVKVDKGFYTLRQTPMPST